ncbi:MAG: type transport system permease protein [Frankiaceae bacterium]|jgi:ABC-2 type transport system permease protein|nr:type transport system permease protein [Frankiaceae bacterium]
MTAVATTLPPATARAGTGPRQAFVALLLRDVRVLRKNLKQFVLRTVMQPLLFTFVFAYVFPKIGQGFGGSAATRAPGQDTFATILVPGLIAVAIIFQGIQSVALPLVQEFSYTKEIEDRVLAPMSVSLVGFGKVVAGAMQAALSALVVFPIVMVVHAKGEGPRVHISNPLLFLAVLLLASFLGAAFGLLIGTSFAPQQVPLVFSIIVLPLTLLGCIYYPWARLTPIAWLKYGVLINPLVYMSEGMRAALTPHEPHMNVAVVVLAMVAATTALLVVSLRKFRQRVVV